MTTTLARIQTRVSAYHETCQQADKWARVASKRIYVVCNDGRYFLADRADLRCYHRRDIYLKRANIVYIARPVSYAPLDVEFAAYGF